MEKPGLLLCRINPFFVELDPGLVIGTNEFIIGVRGANRDTGAGETSLLSFKARTIKWSLKFALSSAY